MFFDVPKTVTELHEFGYISKDVNQIIVNLSLQSAVMHHDFKEAVLKPKIKKDSLDSELFSNFRPICNIRFLAKAVEK